jgi:hypothetical protein
MGEKPGEVDEALAQRESPTRASAGREVPSPRDASLGSPSGIAVNEEGVPEDPTGRHEAAMSAIQNTRREAGPGGAPLEPAEATNLNSSKSNTYREGAPPEDEPSPAEATNLNSSRSNIYREGGGGGGGGEVERRVEEARPRPGPAEPNVPGPAEPGGGPATPGGGP